MARAPAEAKKKAPAKSGHKGHKALEKAAEKKHGGAKPGHVHHHHHHHHHHGSHAGAK